MHRRNGGVVEMGGRRFHMLNDVFNMSLWQPCSKTYLATSSWSQCEGHGNAEEETITERAKANEKGR